PGEWPSQGRHHHHHVPALRLILDESVRIGKISPLDAWTFFPLLAYHADFNPRLGADIHSQREAIDIYLTKGREPQINTDALDEIH
ncbi:hypothetical protein BaRGS_00019848, partial [Batillaria attramentaria]